MIHGGSRDLPAKPANRIGPFSPCRELEVLVEGTDRDGRARGRTPCNRIAHVTGDKPATPGDYLRVRITRGLPNSLLAEAAA